MKNIVQFENLTGQELFARIDALEKNIQKFLTPDNNQKLSIKEVSEECGVSTITVHNWIRKGNLKEVKSLKYKRD